MPERIILCMKWGTKYGPEYVNRLYSMVKRHSDTDFKMVCLTDNDKGITDSVDCYPIPSLQLPEGIPERGWQKLAVFQPDLYGLSGQALFLDLDIVIMDKIDGLFDLAGDFMIIHDWKRPWRITGNSSVFRFTLGKYPDLLSCFLNNLEEVRHRFRNEQAFLSWYMEQQGDLGYWPTHWCKSFKYHCVKPLPFSWFMPPAPPKNARLIIFHGEVNPPDAISGTGGRWYRHILPSPWVEEKWQ